MLPFVFFKKIQRIYLDFLVYALKKKKTSGRITNKLVSADPFGGRCGKYVDGIRSVRDNFNNMHF